METMNLMLGICLLAAFGWIFFRNSKRSSVLHAFLRIETIAGIVAGLYLVISSAASLL
jgi:hypothetical protein